MIESALVAYAKGKAEIMKVWLFGSRVSGQSWPDSDLDVAMELDASTMPHDWSPFMTWAVEHKRFEREIQPLIPYPVHHAHFYSGQFIGEPLEKALRLGRLIFCRR